MRANRAILGKMFEALENSLLTSCGLDQAVQKAARRYLETWVAHPIAVAITDMIENDPNAASYREQLARVRHKAEPCVCGHSRHAHKSGRCDSFATVHEVCACAAFEARP